MDVPSKATSSWAARACVRLAFAFCLVVFGLGDAVERGLAEHTTIDAALTVAVTEVASAAHGVEAAAGGVETGADVVGHGCHGCAAVAEPFRQGATAPIVLGSVLAWTAAPSSAGREPLIDLPPPRA